MALLAKGTDHSSDSEDDRQMQPPAQALPAIIKKTSAYREFHTSQHPTEPAMPSGTPRPVAMTEYNNNLHSAFHVLSPQECAAFDAQAKARNLIRRYRRKLDGRGEYQCHVRHRRSSDDKQACREYDIRGARTHHNVEEGCRFCRVVPQRRFGCTGGGRLGHVRVLFYLSSCHATGKRCSGQPLGTIVMATLFPNVWLWNSALAQHSWMRCFTNGFWIFLMVSVQCNTENGDTPLIAPSLPAPLGTTMTGHMNGMWHNYLV